MGGLGIRGRQGGFGILGGSGQGLFSGRRSEAEFGYAVMGADDVEAMGEGEEV